MQRKHKGRQSVYNKDSNPVVTANSSLRLKSAEVCCKLLDKRNSGKAVHTEFATWLATGQTSNSRKAVHTESADVHVELLVTVEKLSTQRRNLSAQRKPMQTRGEHANSTRKCQLTQPGLEPATFLL
ncbi:uncharacterized protein isoform X2 [Danio rerio]|uniref:Uncharacterized protein isoform X2 n=1 Tax=Danio rerio TaxID=7955 RepID=A0AC58JG87_DANRE